MTVTSRDGQGLRLRMITILGIIIIMVIESESWNSTCTTALRLTDWGRAGLGFGRARYSRALFPFLYPAGEVGIGFAVGRAKFLA
jgi:hypothetical protein